MVRVKARIGSGRQVGVVRQLDPRGDFRLRLLRRVQHVRLAFDQRPLEALFRAVNVEAFAVLPGHVVTGTARCGP